MLSYNSSSIAQGLQLVALLKLWMQAMLGAQFVNNIV